MSSVSSRSRGVAPRRAHPASASAVPLSTTAAASVKAALSSLKGGGAVVVVDAVDRKHEGALVVAAQHCTAATVAFMARHARGLVCLCLTADRCRELRIPPMTPFSEAAYGIEFMMTIEARKGTSTGISAADRARTIEVAIDPASRPPDLVRPGHVVVLRARPRGVLDREGHTEAAVDLARLAGATPAAVTCKIMNDDGTMARTKDLVRYCDVQGFPLLKVTDLVRYRTEGPAKCS
jgi:3,4-dihydroxy 2-butanone 4-phosphate synthase / GTP cyclohydrolase II